MKKIAPLIAGVVMLLVATLLGAFTVTPASATDGGDKDQVCQGLDSGKIDVSGSHKTLTLTAPDGKLIDGYCVKAGSANQDNGPQYETVSPPQKTVTIAHDSAKDISHYSLSYSTAPPPPPPTCQTHPSPQNCPQPPADKQYRDVTGAPDCTAKTVTTEHQERSRPYVWDGDSWEPGAWSAWTTFDTSTRPATTAECPDTWTPETQTENKQTVVVNCETKTVTTTYESRTRTETSDGVWGPWSAWKVDKTETRPATKTECPDGEEPETQTQVRTVEVVDCPTDTVTIRNEKRTRTETSPGVWGPWSEWTLVSTDTRPATDEECPEEPELGTQVQKRSIQGQPNCKTDTVRTIHQERSRSETAPGVWGPWSEWVTVNTEIRPATDEECPPHQPPCEGPCEMPVMDDSKGDLTCRGTVKGGVYDHVRVPRGANCVLVGAYVNKSVETRGAKNVELRGTPVRGDVRLVNVKQDVYVGSKRTCAFDPYIGGSLFVRDSHNVLLCKITVCENVVIDHNDGRITFRDSKTRKLKVVNNNKFRYQGDSDHVLLSVIRIIDVKFKSKVVRNNDPRQVKFLHR